MCTFKIPENRLDNYWHVSSFNNIILIKHQQSQENQTQYKLFNT